MYMLKIGFDEKQISGGETVYTVFPPLLNH